MSIQINPHEDLEHTLQEEIFFQGRDAPFARIARPPKVLEESINEAKISKPQAAITLKGSFKLKAAKNAGSKLMRVEGKSGLLLGNVIDAAKKAILSGKSIHVNQAMADMVEESLEDKATTDIRQG
eukprot:753106-Hanusia_phi.AAC.2